MMFYPHNRLQGENIDENSHWDPTVSLPISHDQSFPKPQDISDVSLLPINYALDEPENDRVYTPPTHSHTILVPTHISVISHQSPHHDPWRTQRLMEPLHNYCRRPQASQQDQSLKRGSDRAVNNDSMLPIAIWKG